MYRLDCATRVRGVLYFIFLKVATVGVSDWRMALTLMSSRFREFRYWWFLFHKMGGRFSPVIPQVSTALWPTVTVVTLSFWSSGRDSMYTSVKGRGDVKKINKGQGIKNRGYNNKQAKLNLC